jgi:hypothetical protein
MAISSMGLQIANRRESERRNYSVDEWYSCGRKNPLSQSEAVGLRRKMNKAKTDGDYFYVEYQCSRCFQWHVGRQFTFNKKRRRRFERDIRAALADAIEVFINTEGRDLCSS